MKKIIISILLAVFSTATFGQISKSVNVATAGSLNSLLNSSEKATITDLTISGSVDARDFKCMRDELSNLAYLDLSAASIVAYVGVGGTSDQTTSVSYPADELPQNSFSTIAGKTSLKTVFLPNTLNAIGVRAFNNCSGLTGINIPNSVATISSNAFYKCSSMAYAAIGSSVTAIGNSAFFDCSKITELSIPNSVVSIGTQAFYSCTKLTTLYLGSGLTSIGDNAFLNCTLLQDLSVSSSLPPSITSSTFSGVNKSTCNLKINSGLISLFQANTYWNQFTNISEIVDPNSFSIILQIGSNGLVSSNNVPLTNGTALMVAADVTHTFKITPRAGYQIASVFYNNQDVKGQLVNNMYTTAPVNSNATLSVTFKKIVIELVIKSAENGSITQICEYGSTPSYSFSPANGWLINSVLFNGNDVTDQIVNKVYTLPVLTSNSELVITFSGSLTTPVQSVVNSRVKVSTNDSQILVEGLDENKVVDLFDVNGQRLTSVKSNGELITIPVSKNTIYLLKTKDQTFKIII